MNQYQNNRQLIIGMGEVGTALGEILVEQYNVFCFDPFDVHYSQDVQGEFEVMHICFPYSENFIQNVKAYQEKYQPHYTVIHSTVPVGTSRKCGASHSPIRGLHPHLESGIKTFTKFIGGEQASEVADIFRRVGLRVAILDKQESTELGKLADTEYYRECIEFCKRIKELCDKQGVPFHEVYTMFNQTYNEGYILLGHPEFVRPVLQPIMKPIGGHCLLPNQKLIKLSEDEGKNTV